MRTTWSEYAQNHQIDPQITKQVRYYLESRCILLAQKEAKYTDNEWYRTMKAALNWWSELVDGTFAGWD